MSKTAAVFTATGIQGSSVVDALLKAGYKVTGFTRDTTGAKAKALTDRGVEVVKADLDDPSTYSDALKDKDAVFVNADFWSFYLNNGYNAEAAKEGEIKHAKNAVQAAVDAGVKHIVYSTLDGGLGCDHWDSKAEVSDWAKQNNYPVTHLYLTAYFNNVYRLGLLKANDDGTFTLGIPCPDDTVVPGLDAEQTGSWVVEAFKNPDKWLGKDMYGVTDAPTVAQMAKTLSEVSGKTVKTNEMSKEYFLSDEFKTTIGKELWDQWKLFYDGNPKRDIPASKALIDGALNFEAWAKQDKALHKALGL